VESYLAIRRGSGAEWHGRAHDLEHGLSRPSGCPAARLRHPTHDPHGDPIPTATGEFSGQQGVPLTTAPVDQPLVSSTWRTSPSSVRQLVAVDLHPGMPSARRGLAGTSRLVPWDRARSCAARGRQCVGRAAGGGKAAETPVGEPLSALQAGTATSRGDLAPLSWAERRRLLDLGVLPGPSSGPNCEVPTATQPHTASGRAHRPAVEQADLIRIERFPEPAARPREATSPDRTVARNEVMK